MNKILIASGNPHKVKKIREIIKPFFANIDDLNSVILDDENFEEEGQSFLEIAESKAIFYSKLYKGLAIASDAGMLIPHLKNWNPLYTKRFVGSKDKTDFERMDELLRRMKNHKDEERTMQWNEAIAIARDGKLIFSTVVEGAEGVVQGHYDVNKYRPGIWLCSLWFFPQFQKNFFDLTPTETEYAEISWVNLNKVVRKFLAKKNVL